LPGLDDEHAGASNSRSAAATGAKGDRDLIGSEMM
jgi:hypothetical protein